MAEHSHLLELDNISKYYGNIIALRDVSTYVNAGEVTCVLGDNGAGKSTFIKILAGVHQQTEGSIRMNGEEVHVRLAPRRARQGHRHRVPGPRDGAADVGVAELLPRRRADQEHRAAQVDRQGSRQADRQGRDGQDGHRHPRHRAAGRHAVGRRASVGGDRPRRLLRCQGADPRRADVGARRQAVGCRAQAHRRGSQPGSRGDLHHPQPAARLPGGQPVPHPQPRPVDGFVREGGHHGRRADPAHGRRCRARRRSSTSSRRRVP